MSATELILPAAILILTFAMFFAIHRVSKQVLTKHRTKNRTTIQSNHHIIQGTHHLARARSTSNKTQAQTLAKTTLLEAENALSLSPKDATPLILKALALEIMGHKNSALKSLDLALSMPRVKSLSEKERGDALLKRAELKLAVNRKRRVDSAVEDLEEAVRLLSQSESTKCRAYCLLGECYEFKTSKEEAKRAFEEALRVDPGFVMARQGLNRLGTSTSPTSH